MWRELITQLDTKSEIVLSAPVAEDQLIDVEQSLAIQFPDNLRGLLLETDGITDIFGVQIIWSIDWIKRNNLANRQDDLVANTFAQYGNLLFLLMLATVMNMLSSLPKTKWKRAMYMAGNMRTINWSGQQRR